MEVIQNQRIVSNKKPNGQRIFKYRSLNRFQKFSSYNDKSYIDGMKKFGATEVEIEYIRALDRASQGVSKDDEFLAISSIEDAQKIGNITVVNAYTDKFSPIIDRLYGKDVLIYNKDHITYYGKNIKNILQRL